MAKRKAIPMVLLPEDIQKIINAILCRGKIQKSYTGYARFCKMRDICMILFCYYAGLRPKECYDAMLDYLNIDKAEFYIPASSNKQRDQAVISLPHFVVDLLYSYLVVRKKVFPKSEWLFPSVTWRNSNGRMNRSTFGNVFRRACIAAGLYKVNYKDAKGLNRHNLSLYSLRHSYGTMVYLKTRDIRKTAMMMRHRDYFCRSTLTYIQSAQGLAQKDLIKQIFNEPNEIEHY